MGATVIALGFSVFDSHHSDNLKLHRTLTAARPQNRLQTLPIQDRKPARRTGFAKCRPEFSLPERGSKASAFASAGEFPVVEFLPTVAILDTENLEASGFKAFSCLARRLLVTRAGGGSGTVCRGLGVWERRGIVDAQRHVLPSSFLAPRSINSRTLPAAGHGTALTAPGFTNLDWVASGPVELGQFHQEFFNCHHHGIN